MAKQGSGVRKRRVVNSDEADVMELIGRPTELPSSSKRKGFEGIKFNKLKCKNRKQRDYSNMIKNNEVTICTGPAGTGKSYVAAATALELLRDPETPFKKLIIVVSVMQAADEAVGYLKGSMEEKISPFSVAYLENIAEMIGGMDKVTRLMEEGFIAIETVAFLRGRNFKNSIVICTEGQQYSLDTFLTVVTRLNDSSRLIIEADLAQCDHKSIKNGNKASGLEHAMECLTDIEGIDFIEFNKNEIVRNKLLTKILTKWAPEIYGDEADYVHQEDQPEYIDEE